VTLVTELLAETLYVEVVEAVEVGVEEVVEEGDLRKTVEVEVMVVCLEMEVEVEAVDDTEAA